MPDILQMRRICRRCVSLEQKYNKSIGDRIPAIIEASGKRCEIVALSNAQFLFELEKKLSEEVAEYQESRNVEELTDILEVICRIVEFKGSPADALEAIRKKASRARRLQEEPLPSKNILTNHHFPLIPHAV